MFGHVNVRSNTKFGDLETYLDIFLNFNAMIIIHDFKGKILKVNKKFLNTLGYSDSDISSLTVKDLLPKESQKVCRKVIDDTLSRGSANHEVTIKKKNQDTFPAYVYTSILEIGDTKLMQCVLHDITERKNVETGLYETNLFLDSIIENIPDMVFLKDAEELRFVRINKAGEELLGYSRKKLLGKNDYDFFPKKEADFFTAKDKTALKTGESINILEEQIHTKAKGTRTLHTKKISIKDKEGNPRYLLGISEDITERKQAQERFKLIVESSPTAIVMVDQDSKIKLINSLGEEIFGYDRSELLGKQVEILVPKSARGQHLKHQKKFMESPLPKRMGAGRDLIARRKDGSEIPVQIGLSPIHTEDGLMILASIVDITERKKAEKELKNSYDELEQTIRERTSDLSKVNEQLRTEAGVRKKAEEVLKQDQVFENAVEALSKNIDNADHVAIYMVEDDLAVLKSHRGYPKWFNVKVARIPKSKGVTWKTLTNGKPLYCRKKGRNKKLCIHADQVSEYYDWLHKYPLPNLKHL